jgi:Bacterial Ig-like domain (group 3)/Right handed beta helix region/Bacterial Ig-like domain
MSRSKKLSRLAAEKVELRARSARRPVTARRRVHVELLEERQLLATITVNTVGDSDSVGATLSLRQAIEISNGTLLISSLSMPQRAQVSGALSSPNTIDFNIPAMEGPVYDIALASPLPTITSPVVINGYSQTGASANTNGPGLADNAVLNIVIDGTSAGAGANGLVISAGSSTVSGLVIANFGTQSGGTGGDGIVLSSVGGNVIAGNFIGTNPAGTAATGIAHDDILIETVSNSNTVGGLTAAARNVLVNNNAGGSSSGAGVDIEGTSGNLVVGNFLGTAATGTKALAGGTDAMGVLMAAGAYNNTVGGTTPAARNLISGNTGSGVQIGATSDTIDTWANLVAGNYIGTDVTGMLPLGNGAGSSPAGDGVDLIGVNSIGNTIGGSAAAAGNLISANAYDGIYVDYATDDTLESNLIGADAARNFGDKSMGNTDYGIEIDNGPRITIAKNLVVNNKTGGIALYYALTENDWIIANESILNDGDGILFCSCGSGGSLIYGNLIGTDATGTANLGNQGDGIDIGSPNNTVGGSAGMGNVIAFNTQAGIGFEQSNTNTGNLLSANLIYANQKLGIDLAATGVPLQNTAGGPHVGPNDLQNYPVLTSASASSSGTAISGSLNSVPNQTFTIQFFSNPVLDASGYGQGQTYVGSTSVHTDASGNANFGLEVPASIGGQLLSAIAIAAGGDTSEFAKSILVGTTVPPASPIATTTTLTVSPNPSTAGQPITMTATVTASDGSSPTGDVTFIVDNIRLAPAVPLQVVGGQDVATFETSSLTPASYVISAEYAGSSVYMEGVSNSVGQIVQSAPVVAPPPPVIAPTVTQVNWFDNRASATTIAISFSEAINLASAQNTSDYTILTAGRHGQFGGEGSKRIRVTKAVYDAGSQTVTLDPSRRLNINHRYELIVSGQAPKGVASANAVMLDGADNGQPGTNYVGVLDKQNLILDPPNPPRPNLAAAAVARRAAARLERRG